jgi:hypothetical protein
MLIENLSLDERVQLRTAVEVAAVEDDEGPIRDIINRIAWIRIRERWDKVIWKFWILKTLRYRDLEGVWVVLFGQRPAGVP